MTNNILPDVWGPHGWKFMHYVALGYPEQPTDQDKAAYRSYFEALQRVLPCKSCATHYQENLRKFPVGEHLKDRDSLMRWTIALHNEVNLATHKPVIPYETALKLYTQRQFPLISLLGKIVIAVLLLIGASYLLRR